MKLHFDNHLSHRLIERLNDVFPGSSHVLLEGLDESDDKEIWAFASEHDFTIVTKDSDFNDLSILRGHPPKVIWLRVGNCRFSDIEAIIRNRVESILGFTDDPNVGILEID